jgi:hypothetical protein
MPGGYDIDLNPSYFDAVHSISPYHFCAVNPETAGVMSPGATLQVSGNNKRNKYSRASDAQVPEEAMPDFKTRTHTKPNAGDECPGSA